MTAWKAGPPTKYEYPSATPDTASSLPSFIILAKKNADNAVIIRNIIQSMIANLCLNAANLWMVTYWICEAVYRKCCRMQADVSAKLVGLGLGVLFVLSKIHLADLWLRLWVKL